MNAAEQAIEALIDGHSEDILEENRCPKCGSTKVLVGYPEITCMACGQRDPLVDYPISYREHGVYYNNFGQMDLPTDVPYEPAPGIETRIDKLASQVNMLMGQAVYRQQRQQSKPGLPRIDV